MTEPVLKLKDLSIGYHTSGSKKVLLSGVSSTLGKGKMVMLLGPNGVGKSTLLRTIAGLLPSLSGEIYLSGNQLDKRLSTKISSLVSVVFPWHELKPNLSVREYVSLGLYRFLDWKGCVSVEDEKHITDTILRFQLEKISNHKVYELSDGEFQRVELARVFVQQTPLVLLDEPTSHLDFSSRYEIMDLLKTMTKESGVSMIVSTHEVDLARCYGDLFWMIKKDNSFWVDEKLSTQTIDQLYGINISYRIENK